MKKTVLLFAIMIFSSVLLTAQQVIVTDDPAHTTPSTGAMLDVFSSDKGFLPPKVALTAANAASPITSPSTGLIVYNTATAGTSPNNVIPGYYYNSGTTGAPVWARLMNTDLTNGISIQDDGSFILNGTATVFNDLVVPGFAGFSSSTNPPDVSAFLGSTLLALNFAGNASNVDQIFFSVQMPHDWKEGTTIYPHVHWSPQIAATGNVVWQIEYSWANYDATTPVAYPTPVTIIATSANVLTTDVDKHLITGFPEITTSVPATNNANGKKISSILVCRFFRDAAHASDTYGSNAALLSFDIHYEVDAMGSRSQFTK